MPRPELSLLRRLAAVELAPDSGVPREGLFGGYRLTWSGIQVSTIDGQEYATLFDFHDPKIHGLKPGAIIEWEPSGRQQQGWNLEYAKIYRMVAPPEGQSPVARLLARLAP